MNVTTYTATTILKTLTIYTANYSHSVTSTTSTKTGTITTKIISTISNMTSIC